MKKQKISILVSLFLILSITLLVALSTVNKKDDTFQQQIIPLICLRDQRISTHLPDALVCTYERATSTDYLIEDFAPTNPYSLPPSINPQALLLDWLNN